MDRNCRLTAYAPDRPVALRKESVDRNSSGAKADSVSKVALRKESVDRNFLLCGRLSMVTVALRKESVDRNFGMF